MTMRRSPTLVAVAVLFHQMVLLLHFPVGTESYECLLFHNKIKVQIINRIIRPESIDPTIELHCWSKDDNLGWHTLHTNEQFEFRFCVTPFSTVFECKISWNGQDVHLYVYDATFGYDSCGTDGSCIWEVMRDFFGNMSFMLDNRTQYHIDVGTRITRQPSTLS